MLTSGVSFNVTKQVKSNVLTNISVPDISNDEDVKEKRIPSNKKLVIPIPSKNNKRLLDLQEDTTNDDNDDINDNHSKKYNNNINDKNSKKYKKETSDILKEILLKNEKTFQSDVDSLAQTNDDDYNVVPIEDFGLALLRGMGWKEGDKQVEIKEVVLRPRGLGLSAGKKHQSADDDAKRKKDVGDDNDALHKNGFDEDLKKGCYCVVDAGKYKGMCGTVIGFDDDNTRVMVKLEQISDIINITHYIVSKISEKKFKSYSTRLNSDETTQHQLPQNGSVVEGHNSKNAKQFPSKSTKSHWLRNNLIVRIIDKHFKKGKFYKQKVTIEDVTTPYTCTCRTSDNLFLEDLEEDQLETVIPKEERSHVMIVRGPYKGQVAILLKKNKKDETVLINLVDDSSKLLTLNYDDICQCEL